MASRQTMNPKSLRDRLLDHFSVLRIPITAGQFDAVTARAEREHLPHLEFLEALIGEQANQRRERSIQYRIREAAFREPQSLEAFDWKFNAATIDRVQIEELATGDFIRRNTPPDAIVMIDTGIDGIDYARRWSGRRALLANQVHGSMVYTNQELLRQVRELCSEIAETGLGPSQLQALRRWNVSLAIVRRELLSSQIPADDVLFSNDRFAVVRIDEQTSLIVD